MRSLIRGNLKEPAERERREACINEIFLAKFCQSFGVESILEMLEGEGEVEDVNILFEESASTKVKELLEKQHRWMRSRV
jgi:hypothetical protein